MVLSLGVFHLDTHIAFGLAEIDLGLSVPRHAPVALRAGALEVGGEALALFPQQRGRLLEVDLLDGPLLLGLDEVVVELPEVLVLLRQGALTLSQLFKVLQDLLVVVAQLVVQGHPVADLVGERHVLELEVLNVLRMAGHAEFEDGLVLQVTVLVLVIFLILGLAVFTILLIFPILLIFIAILVLVLIRLDLATLTHHDALLDASLLEGVERLTVLLGRRVADELKVGVLVVATLGLDEAVEEGPCPDVDVVLGKAVQEVADDAVLVGILLPAELQLALGLLELLLGLEGADHDLVVFGVVFVDAAELAQEPPQS
ncbi:hypothetical protein PG993_005711 [Apiospora rasikravindrae]|uniref:Uncharacterized protein n=1 Tax=Apiospora rasikravindrae TaxID=990691 RepID=A0ABR1TBC4_9PEZI